MHNSLTNIHKLGDRDLLISSSLENIWARLIWKILGFEVCNFFTVSIFLQQKHGHKSNNIFLAPTASKCAVITWLKSYLPQKDIFIDLCFFSHTLSWCHPILILSSCTKQSLHCNSVCVFQCFSDTFISKPKSFEHLSKTSLYSKISLKINLRMSMYL